MSVFIMNSATQAMTFLVVATDHITGATGQSPVVRFSKAGATAFSTATQAVTEMQFGWYKLTLATGNVDTMGELAVHVTSTGGDDTDEKHYVGPVSANTIRFASATIDTASAQVGVNVIQAATVGWLSGAIASGTFSASAIDAAAFATSARDEIVDQVWDELISAHTATTSFGAIVGANLDATISSRATTATQGPTAAVIADAVWDEVLSGHTSTGSAGDFVQRIDAKTTNLPPDPADASDIAASFASVIAAIPSAATIADQVWDELAAGHTATTSFGAILQALTSGGGATASDIWTTALPGAYAAGSAGFILGTNLDATVSSRSTATQGPTATVIADTLLDRDMSAVSDSNSRSPLNALRFLRNKWSMATDGTGTVFKENDATAAWTFTATGDSSATPITGNDPA